MKTDKKQILCSVFFLCCLMHHEVNADFKTTYIEAIHFIQRLDKQIKAVLATDKPITFTLRQLLSNIPPLQSVKLPDAVTKMLDVVELQLPQVNIQGESYEMKWENALVLGKQMRLPVRLYVGPGKQGEDGGLSLSIGILGKNTLNTLLPDLKHTMIKMEATALPNNVRTALQKAHLGMEDFAKIVDWLEFEDLGLIVSTKFVDPVWGELEVGLNATATLRFLGPLEHLTSFLGKDLTALKTTGIITPDLTGSEMRAALPGKLTLLRWPLDQQKPLFFGVRTGGVQCRIGLTAGGALTIKGIAALDVQLPFQKEYTAFNGSLDVLPLTATGPAVELAGWMNGMLYNMFGLPGFDVGNLGIGITFSLASAVLFGTPTAVSCKGEMHLGPVTREVLFAIDLNKTQIAARVHAGELSTTDVVDYVVHVMDAGAQLIKKPLDEAGLKKIFYSVMPPFKFSELDFYFVPEDSEVFDVWYTKGIHIKGGAELFGVGGDIELGLMMYSGLIPALKGSAYLKEIKIPKTNPAITISGAGKNMQRGDADDGPVLMVELSPERQIMYMDGFLSIPALNISSDTRFHWKLQGMECDIHHKLGGLFDAQLHLRTDLTAVDAFEVSGFMDQQGLGLVGKYLQDEAKKFSDAAQKDLTAALANVKAWEQQAQKDIDTWIALQVINVDKDIKALLDKIHAADKRCQTSDFLHLIPNCAEELLVPSYWVSVGVLQVHKEVTLKGVAREVARLGVGAASLGAQIGLKTAQVGVEVARATTDFAGKLLRGGCNISKITFAGSMKELLDQGTLPRVDVTGTILGKPFQQTYQINFKNAQQLPAQIVAGLAQVFGPQPQPYKNVVAQ